MRATNCLQMESVETLRDLVTRPEAEMLEVRNFGKTSLKEVKKRLTEMGLTFGMDLSILE